MHLQVIIYFLFITSMLAAEENFLLVNGLTNEIVMTFGTQIEERISPCSSFKITLSLIGYDSDVLEDEHQPIWHFQDGYDDYYERWKGPIDPTSWMNTSCIWYSKVITRMMGLKKVEDYLISMNYGNHDMSGGLEHPAWVNSSLIISPKEQVDFIQNLVLKKLPISSNAIEMTKAILFKETLSDGWKLYGKTGWSGSYRDKNGQTQEHGWFVGWIEKEDQFFPFAYLIQDKKITLDQRIPRVKQLLYTTELKSRHAD